MKNKYVIFFLGIAAILIDIIINSRLISLIFGIFVLVLAKIYRKENKNNIFITISVILSLLVTVWAALYFILLFSYLTS